MAREDGHIDGALRTVVLWACMGLLFWLMTSQTLWPPVRLAAALLLFVLLVLTLLRLIDALGAL